MQLRFHFPKIVELIIKTVFIFPSRGVTVSNCYLRDKFSQSKHWGIFVEHKYQLFNRVFLNTGLVLFSGFLTVLDIQNTKKNWLYKVGQLLIETTHYSERLEFESAIYSTEFFIGKYNDLNIVWFWRFITSLQTCHTMKTKLVKQSPKFSVECYPVHEKYSRHFLFFHFSQNWKKFTRFEFS